MGAPGRSAVARPGAPSSGQRLGQVGDVLVQVHGETGQRSGCLADDGDGRGHLVPGGAVGELGQDCGSQCVGDASEQFGGAGGQHESHQFEDPPAERRDGGGPVGVAQAGGAAPVKLAVAVSEMTLCLTSPNTWYQRRCSGSTGPPPAAS